MVDIVKRQIWRVAHERSSSLYLPNGKTYDSKPLIRILEDLKWTVYMKFQPIL
jgi:hypothetical protein